MAPKAILAAAAATAAVSVLAAESDFKSLCASA